MDKTIKLNNTPSLTLEFVKNWLAHMERGKDKHPAAHIAILQDVVKLIEVAISVLEPGPTESGNAKN